MEGWTIAQLRDRRQIARRSKTVERPRLAASFTVAVRPALKESRGAAGEGSTSGA